MASSRPPRPLRASLPPSTPVIPSHSRSFSPVFSVPRSLSSSDPLSFCSFLGLFHPLYIPIPTDFDVPARHYPSLPPTFDPYHRVELSDYRHRASACSRAGRLLPAALAHLSIAILYEGRGFIWPAIKQFERFSVILNDLTSVSLSESSSVLSSHCYPLLHNSLGVAYYRLSLQLLKRDRDTPILPKAHRDSLSDCPLTVSDCISRSLEHLNQAILFDQSITQLPSVARIVAFFNLAIVERSRGIDHFAIARSHIEAALECACSPGLESLVGQCRALGMLAELQLQASERGGEADLDIAQRCADRFVDLCELIGDTGAALRGRLVCAKISMLLGHFAAACSQMNLVLEEAARTKDTEVLNEAKIGIGLAKGKLNLNQHMQKLAADLSSTSARTAQPAASTVEQE